MRACKQMRAFSRISCPPGVARGGRVHTRKIFWSELNQRFQQDCPRSCGARYVASLNGRRSANDVDNGHGGGLMGYRQDPTATTIEAGPLGDPSQNIDWTLGCWVWEVVTEGKDKASSLANGQLATPRQELLKINEGKEGWRKMLSD